MEDREFQHMTPRQKNQFCNGYVRGAWSEVDYCTQRYPKTMYEGLCFFIDLTVN